LAQGDLDEPAIARFDREAEVSSTETSGNELEGP